MYVLRFSEKKLIFSSKLVLIIFIIFVSIISGCNKYDSSSNSYGNTNTNTNTNTDTDTMIYSFKIWHFHRLIKRSLLELQLNGQIMTVTLILLRVEYQAHLQVCLIQVILNPITHLVIPSTSLEHSTIFVKFIIQ